METKHGLFRLTPSVKLIVLLVSVWHLSFNFPSTCLASAFYLHPTLPTAFIRCPSIPSSNTSPRPKCFPFVLCFSSTSSSPPPPSVFSPPIVIPDAQPLYPLSAFALPHHFLAAGELEAVLLPSGLIEDRIDKMAQDLLDDLFPAPFPPPGGLLPVCELHLLCVLKGASRFFHALLASLRRRAQAQRLPLQIQIEFITVRSYSGMQSTGTVDVSGCVLGNLQGRNVVLVEDMIDTVPALPP
ncbi:hypoxanthine-guanine phosphoribosyltransferase, partial [Nannochloropsis gaditana]